jgi:hypothetical protein
LKNILTNVFEIIYSPCYQPETIEFIAIKQYLQHYPIRHFPVDNYPVNEKDLLSDAQIIRNNSKEYRELWNKRLNQINESGYYFLNGDDMDKEKMEQLKAKKLLLQEEVRLKNLRGSIGSQIAHLEKTGHSYTVYYEAEHLNWIDSNVQVRKRDGYTGIHGDFQIDADDSKAISILKMKEVDIDSDEFKKEFLSLIPEDSMLNICYLSVVPELEIAVKAFLEKPTEFFSLPETWLLTTDKKWIVEYLWVQNKIRFIQLKGSTPTLIKTLVIED